MEHVCRVLDLRRRRGARLGLGLGFGSGLGPWCGDGFGRLLVGGLAGWPGFRLRRGGGLGFWPGCRRTLCWGALPPRLAGSGLWGCWSLGGGGGAAGGDGFLGARLDGVARGFWCGVLVGGVVVEIDEVVVVVEVVESDAEETDVGGGWGSRVESEVEQTDVGDGGGSQTAAAGVGCWVLWAMRVRVRVRASGVCARFPWRPVWVQVPVPWMMSCVLLGGVAELSGMRG